MEESNVVDPIKKIGPTGFSVSNALCILRSIDRQLEELREQASHYKNLRDRARCRDMLLAALDYAKVLREIALLEIRHHDLVVQIERDHDVRREFVSELKAKSCGFCLS